MIMRPILSSSMMIAALLVGIGPLASFAHAGKRPPRPAVQHDTPTWQVTGIGKTRGDADEDALEKAREKVGEYLATRYNETAWMPTRPYLWQQGIARLAGEPPTNDLQLAGPWVERHQKWGLTPKAVASMV